MSKSKRVVRSHATNKARKQLTNCSDMCGNEKRGSKQANCKYTCKWKSKKAGK